MIEQTDLQTTPAVIERELWAARQKAVAHADDCLMVYRAAVRQAILANEAWLDAFRRLGGA